ncbi:hypothetical protein GCM10010502_57200 [Kitasatospora aureofaciens]|uniref:Uncharacterized protein n=1 Tax=Kitasatospora aureofaciens TaxID=1894 RepID=A0A8H9HZ72_KITAU|nr:hypothetical protein GCM10010502_57200 [Kitasatospora aureofaciens]
MFAVLYAPPTASVPSAAACSVNRNIPVPRDTTLPAAINADEHSKPPDAAPERRLA